MFIQNRCLCLSWSQFTKKSVLQFCNLDIFYFIGLFPVDEYLGYWFLVFTISALPNIIKYKSTCICLGLSVGYFLKSKIVRLHDTFFLMLIVSAKLIYKKAYTNL